MYKEEISYEHISWFPYIRENTQNSLRADLLVDGLLELLVVEDGPHLPVAVGAPEGGHYLHLGVAHVHPEHGHHVVIRIKLCSQLIEENVMAII